jgi:hypothetical protein
VGLASNYKWSLRPRLLIVERCVTDVLAGGKYVERMSQESDLGLLRGPFVEWSPSDDVPHDVAGQLAIGHPGVIENRGAQHLSVIWIGYEDELVTTGAVYDAAFVAEIDVYTFCSRVMALNAPPSDE